jgi:uncharacterized protein (TIGR02996 family)
MDEGSWLAAIGEDDEGDGPRLAFADWLEERGDQDRAEFIRVQCALASLPEADPQRPGLARRERALLDRHAWEWAAPLEGLVTRWDYRRGFIEKVEMSLESSAPAIVEPFRRMPTIRHLRDPRQFCELEHLLGAVPHLPRLTGLELWGLYAIADKELRALLASPQLAGLRTLILHHDRNGNLVKNATLIEAITQPCRAALVELAVNVDGAWRGPGNAIVKAIAACPHLGGLRRLNLSYARMDRPTARALGDSPHLSGLTELDLGGCALTAPAWDELLRARGLAGLRRLRLHGARLVDTGGDSLGRLADLPDRRAAIEGRFGAGAIDWRTEFIFPMDPPLSPTWGVGCWMGFGWADRGRPRDREATRVNPAASADTPSTRPGSSGGRAPGRGSRGSRRG